MSNSGNGNSDDDNFGLPDLDYKPLSSEPAPSDSGSPAASVNDPTPAQEFDHPTTSESVDPGWPEDEPEESPAATQVSEPYRPKEDDGVSPGRVLMYILIPVLLLAGGYFGYEFFIRQPAMKEAALKQALKKEEADRKRKEAEAKKAKEAEAAAAAAQQAKATDPPPAGTIETLTGPTRRYYVVVASSLDADLLMDRARQLSASGVSCKIIPPFGQWKFHRLGILDQETFALAQAKAEESKATYGNDIWVMRY